MQRINTANAVLDLFGAGKNGFSAGNPATNTPATFLNADWCNMVQEELATIVESVEALDPTKRYQVLGVLKKLFMSNNQVIDRTGESSVALLDRFDVVHKYRVSRQSEGNGVFPSVIATTGLVQGGVYEVLVQTETGPGFENLDFSLRPNSTSYAGQFSANFVCMADPGVTTSAVSYRNGVNSPNTSSVNDKFSIDTYNGNSGSNGVIRLTAFAATANLQKKVLISSGDTAGIATGFSIWMNNTVAWSTLGTLSFYTTQNSTSSGYLIDVFVRRIA
jgi:hypothetical protein